MVKISSIFKWYQEDFEKGWLGYRRLEDFLIAHRDADIEFLDYDWRLNQKR